MNGSYYPGLDILKVCMSILVVGIHTHFWLALPVFGGLLDLLNVCAVPTFLAISSFLFFSKISKEPAREKEALISYSKRLLILLLVWEVVMLPVSIPAFYIGAPWYKIIFRILFASTFGGLWFIKALLYSMLILCSFPDRYRGGIILVMSLLFLLMNKYIDALNQFFHFEIFFVFFYHFANVGAGYVLHKYRSSPAFTLPQWYYLLLFVGAYLLSLALGIHSSVLRLLAPYCLIPFFLHVSVNHKYWRMCRSMRYMSIMVFMLHFIYLYLLDNLLEDIFSSYLLSSAFLHISILSLSFATAWLILKFEKHFSLLRFLH